MDESTHSGACAHDRTGSSPFALAGVVLAALAASAALLLALKSDDTQRFWVGQAPGVYRPAELQARSGKPVDITFTRSGGCMDRVTFPELGLTADITKGGTVHLPAMRRGTYRFMCSKGRARGTIRVGR